MVRDATYGSVPGTAMIPTGIYPVVCIFMHMYVSFFSSNYIITRWIAFEGQTENFIVDCNR